jgi:hypothetical protein
VHVKTVVYVQERGAYAQSVYIALRIHDSVPLRSSLTRRIFVMPFDKDSSINDGTRVANPAFANIQVEQWGGETRAISPSLLRRSLWGLYLFIAVAIAVPVALIAGGVAMIGSGWYNITYNGVLSLDASQVAGIVLVFIGLAFGAGSAGMAIVYAGMNRKRLGHPVAAMLASLIAVGCFLTAYLGSSPLLPTYVEFVTVTYDQLRFFLGMLLLAIYTAVGIGALCVAANIATLHWCSVSRSRTQVGTREALVHTSKAPSSPQYGLKNRITGITTFSIVIFIVLFLSTILPACWNAAIPGYWTSGIVAGGLLKPSWLVNSNPTTWTFNVDTSTCMQCAVYVFMHVLYPYLLQAMSLLKHPFGAVKSSLNCMWTSWSSMGLLPPSSSWDCWVVPSLPAVHSCINVSVSLH